MIALDKYSLDDSALKYLRLFLLDFAFPPDQGDVLCRI